MAISGLERNDGVARPGACGAVPRIDSVRRLPEPAPSGGRSRAFAAFRAAHLFRPRSDDGLDRHPVHYLRRHHLGQAQSCDRGVARRLGDGRDRRAGPERSPQGHRLEHDRAAHRHDDSGVDLPALRHVRISRGLVGAEAKANPAGILLLLQITTAMVSALLDNVTTVLLVVPVTLAITKELDVPPYPFLFAEVFASNIGGTATLIGDPPNILIGSLVGLDFNAFIIHLAPVIVVIMAVQTLMIHLLWGRTLRSTPTRRALVMGMNTKETILDRTLLRQSLVVLT